MQSLVRTSRIGRPLFAALVLLALAIRVAVPTGFMPTATERGVVVSICTGEGVLSHVIDLGDQDSGAKQQGGQSHCLFASAFGGALLPDLAGEARQLWMPALVSLGTAIAHLTIHRLAAPPPPSQAPPARA